MVHIVIMNMKMVSLYNFDILGFLFVSYILTALRAYARSLKIHCTMLRISHGTSHKLAFHCVKGAFDRKKVDFFSVLFGITPL